MTIMKIAMRYWWHPWQKWWLCYKDNNGNDKNDEIDEKNDNGNFDATNDGNNQYKYDQSQWWQQSG